MASPQAFNDLNSRLYVRTFDHDPAATSAEIVTPDGGTTIRTLDLADYHTFAVQVMLTVPASSSGITLVEIVASAATDMSSPEVIATSGTIDADAVGDLVFLEVSAAQVAQEGEDAGKELRYVAARITCSNAGDEAAAVYMARPRFCHLDETPATVIA